MCIYFHTYIYILCIFCHIIRYIYINFMFLFSCAMRCFLHLETVAHYISVMTLIRWWLLKSNAKDLPTNTHKCYYKKFHTTYCKSGTNFLPWHCECLQCYFTTFCCITAVWNDIFVGINRGPWWLFTCICIGLDRDLRRAYSLLLRTNELSDMKFWERRCRSIRVLSV